MQNSVVFALLLCLLQKRKVKRRDMAEQFELSERTISRYFDTLQSAGVPIVTTRGANGGYAISDDFMFDNMFFSESELNRLITCLNAVPEYRDGVNDILLSKLKTLAASASENRFLISADTLVIDSGSWNNPGLYRNKIDVINKAILNCNTINMKYTDRNESSSERLFDPYFLVLKEGVWYTYGFCRTRNDFRLFKLARIRSMITTDNTFDRKQTDVYEKLKGRFDDVTYLDVEFEFFATVLADVEEWLGPDAIIERGLKYIAKANLPGGRLLTNKLLSFGSSIKIISPPALKEEILDECRRILKYAT